MDVGFSFYLILARMYDVDPKLAHRRKCYIYMIFLFYIHIISFVIYKINKRLFSELRP